MRTSPVNLLGGFNRDDSAPWSVQDVVNYLPVVADQPGTRTQYKMRTPPGLRPFQQIGTGPIRGEHNCEGRLFVVSGQTLYEVTAAGVGIPRGKIPGIGRVRMAHNQVKNGNQVAVANGQSGYIYNTATQAFTRITDDGFPGAIDVKFIDGFLFYVEPFGRFWLHSDLADGLSYNTLDRGEAEAQPDRIVGLAVNQGEAVIFGERTTEFYGNTGQATGTFQSKGVTCDVGCASLHTIQNLDNSVMWLGHDGVVYRLDGYGARPISSRSIEKAVAKYRWQDAFAFTWEDEGHKVYYLTFPDGQTFGYDVVVGLWHRRESFGLDRWRINGCAYWQRKWIGTDFQNGRLWQLDWDYFLEGDQEFVSEFTTGVLHDDGNRLIVNEAEILFHTGGIPTSPSEFPVQPIGPTIAGHAPGGTVGAQYEGYSYTVTQGDAAILGIAVIAGALPGGLSITGAGVIPQGIPTLLGRYKFTLRVTDLNGLYADLDDSILVGETIALLGTGSVRFFLIAPGGTDWDNAYSYSGDTPPLGPTGMIGGGGRWLTYGASAANPVYSASSLGVAWTQSAAVFGEETRTPFGCYAQGTFLIPANSGIYRSADHGVTLEKLVMASVYAIAASPSIAMAVGSDSSTVRTSAHPFTVWEAKGGHGLFMSTGASISYGGGKFLIGGATAFRGTPKAVMTKDDGATFVAVSLPALSPGHFSASAYDGVNGRWVAGTSAGQLVYMDEKDGVWRIADAAFGAVVTVRSIVHNGIVFVALGADGGNLSRDWIKYSEDGKTWVTAPTASAVAGQMLAVMK